MENRKRTREKKPVCSLIVLVEHSTTKEGERERQVTCGLKVVVSDETTAMLVVAATAEKTGLPENNHNETHIYTYKGLSSSPL